MERGSVKHCGQKFQPVHVLIENKWIMIQGGKDIGNLKKRMVSISSISFCQNLVDLEKKNGTNFLDKN